MLRFYDNVIDYCNSPSKSKGTHERIFNLLGALGLAMDRAVLEAAVVQYPTPAPPGRTTDQWSTTTEPWPTPTVTKQITFRGIFRFNLSFEWVSFVEICFGC